MSTCVAAPAAPPPPPPAETPAQRCAGCLRGDLGAAALASAVNETGRFEAGSAAYQACLAYLAGAGAGLLLPSTGGGLRASSAAEVMCRRLEKESLQSPGGNMARRAGLLCGRLGACSADVRGNLTTFHGALMAQPVTGPLDLCSVEGVSGGQLAVPGVATSSGEGSVRMSPMHG
jgi:hypothetical protein